MSTTPPPPSPTTAGSPFDNPDADVILRSSDGVDFWVFKVILSLASPVFKTMFSLPKPNDSTLPLADSPPVIELPEDSDTLGAILLLCYPGTSPTLASLHKVSEFAAALVKYDMEPVLRPAKEIIFSQFLEKHPVSLYALGCQYGWRDVAERAAAETLKIKDLGRTTLYVDEMETMTTATYQRLISYHIACGVAAQKVASSGYHRTPSRSTGLSKFTLDVGEVKTSWHEEVYRVASGPLGSYKTQSGEELLSRPSPTTLYDPAFSSFPTFMAAAGLRTKDQVESMENGRRVFFDRVQEAVSSVKLDFKS